MHNPCASVVLERVVVMLTCLALLNVVGGVWVQCMLAVSTLMTSGLHAHNNMTRAMLVKSLHYQRFVHAPIPAPRSGRIGLYQPCKAFGKLFTQLLPLANGFLFLKLSFDLPFPRLNVHRQTRDDYCNPPLRMRARVNDLSAHLHHFPIILWGQK